ncbi:hypothetical protein ACFPMF_01875 [Larkinella bovis]|uniref:XRE family transcriptional regulator n=1 Tax=Larkinella bovis TaxID=683041 RepID=A0ABW0I3E7_9BACT
MKTVEEIKSCLCNGDYARIGKMVGVSRNYAKKLMDRPTSARFEAVIKAAEKVAKSNIDLGLVTP